MRLFLIKAALILFCGVPIVVASCYFVWAARRMMREEMEKERMRQGAAQAMRYDRRRRRAQGMSQRARTGACR